jgi:hypothetical protein
MTNASPPGRFISRSHSTPMVNTHSSVPGIAISFFVRTSRTGTEKKTTMSWTKVRPTNTAARRSGLRRRRSPAGPCDLSVTVSFAIVVPPDR